MISLRKSNSDLNVLVILVLLMFCVSQQFIFANHGEEIDLKFSDAQFFIYPAKNISQVKYTTIYSVSDSSIVGELINGIMQIYVDNGTLIKTTSIPNGFTADESGFQQFVTSLPTTSIKNITTVVSFTDLNKTSLLSNTINRDLSLNAIQ